MLTLRRKGAKRRYNPDPDTFAASRLSRDPISMEGGRYSRQGPKAPREGVTQI
jgi:hypothetical protein